MKRGKIGYDFCPLPRKRHPAWRALKHLLGNCIPEKFWLLNDGKPVQVHGDDWRVSICRDLAIEARHRKHWCDAMREAERAGLLTHSEGFVSIHIEQAQPRLTSDSPEVHPHLTLGSPEVHSGFTSNSIPVSNENHSTPILQTEETDKTEESESAGARTHTREVVHFRIPLGEPPPELPPAEPPLAHTIVQAHAAEYAKRTAGLKPPSDYTAAKQLADWCEAGASAYATDAKTLALRCVAALFVHPRAGAARWPLHWMVGKHDTTEFAGLPSGVKPIAMAPRLDARTQREQLEELRDRVKQAHIRVNRMANAPWFDKEAPGFPERERNAAAELAAANAALREATSAAKMAVAS
jgi:hypothetical protein